MASISEVDISIKYRINFISTRNQIKSEKNGPLRQKTAKNGYLYVPFSQKLLFKVKKSHSLNAAHDKKTALA